MPLGGVMQDIRRGGDVTWSRESAMIDMSLVEHPVFHKTSESQASQALGLRGRKEDHPVPSDREDRFLGDAEVCGFFRRLFAGPPLRDIRCARRHWSRESRFLLFARRKAPGDLPSRDSGPEHLRTSAGRYCCTGRLVQGKGTLTMSQALQVPIVPSVRFSGPFGKECERIFLRPERGLAHKDMAAFDAVEDLVPFTKTERIAYRLGNGRLSLCWSIC